MREIIYQRREDKREKREKKMRREEVRPKARGATEGNEQAGKQSK